MFSIVGIIFSLLEKTFTDKKCVSTNGIYVSNTGESFLQAKIIYFHLWKYISSTGKNSFYRQKHVSTSGNHVHPQLGKIVLYAKVCAAASQKYGSTTGKNSFTGKNMFPIVRNIVLLVKLCVSISEKFVSTNERNFLQVN